MFKSKIDVFKSKIDVKFGKLITWRWIRSVAEMKFVTTSYIWVFIIPVIANLFSEINSGTIAVFNFFGHETKILLKLPFSWSILFFSALLFLIGYVIYLARSPNIIKDHPTFSSFKDDGKNFKHLVSYGSEIDPVQSIYKNREAMAAYNTKDNKTEEYYWELIDQGDYLNPKSRYASAFCLIGGFMLVAWLIIQNIISVTNNALFT